MTDWTKARYENVFDYIQDGVLSGALVSGKRLAGERKLAEELGVSRETIRQGLDLAEQAGLIVRVPQRGTYVASPRVDQDLGAMRTFDQTVRGLSMSPAYQLLRAESIRLDAEAAVRLEVAPESDGLAIEVIGLANGLPMALYRAILPVWIVDRVGRDTNWGERASYELAGEAMSAPSLDVRQEFEAIELRGDVAQRLRVRSGMPGFMSTSIFLLPGGKPVEVRKAWYPGNRYRFSTTRRIEIKPASDPATGPAADQGA